jgi:hypothetical protein
MAPDSRKIFSASLTVAAILPILTLVWAKSGPQISTTELNGDGKTHIPVAGKSGTFVLIHRIIERQLNSRGRPWVGGGSPCFCTLFLFLQMAIVDSPH